MVGTLTFTIEGVEYSAPLLVPVNFKAFKPLLNLSVYVESLFWAWREPLGLLLLIALDAIFPPIIKSPLPVRGEAMPRNEHDTAPAVQESFGKQIRKMQQT